MIISIKGEFLWYTGPSAPQYTMHAHAAQLTELHLTLAVIAVYLQCTLQKYTLQVPCTATVYVQYANMPHLHILFDPTDTL